MIITIKILKLAAVVTAIVMAAVVQVASAQSGASHAQMHHPKASPEAIALHDLMEPLWHAASSPERSAKACQIADEIKIRTKAAATRPTPDNDAIVGSSRALANACAEKNPSAVGIEIDRMHRFFYKIAE